MVINIFSLHLPSDSSCTVHTFYRFKKKQLFELKTRGLQFRWDIFAKILRKKNNVYSSSVFSIRVFFVNVGITNEWFNLFCYIWNLFMNCLL